MTINPGLKELGFDQADRVAIIHTDDIGMYQSANAAFADLWALGSISSGSVMVPCPWFPQISTYCQKHPGVDMGVHLTLNSEWKVYRWGPLSTVDVRSGLIDDDGYFHQDPDVTETTADLDLLRLELNAQLSKAMSAGIDVTHIDTHMFLLASHRFFHTYIQVGLTHDILPVVIRPGSPAWYEWGFDGEHAQTYTAIVEPLVEQGLPMIDHVSMMNLETPEERLEEAKQRFDQMPPGLTHFVLHPTTASAEVSEAAWDWPCRVADYETFMDLELKTHWEQTGVQIIGYRELRDLMRKKIN